MKYNEQEIKKNTVIAFTKDDVEYMGKVDYIRYARYLRGEWGSVEVDPLVDSFKVLRTFDGKLTHDGEVYNATHAIKA
jgi:hypothetical protein